jgi:hypothetical protein
MTPEQAMQVIEFHKDLNFFEALALAKKQGKILVPNYVLDRILMETKAESTGWTGTCVIYEAPDKPFGEKVVFGWKDDDEVQNLVRFAVPEQFRGKTNCALIVEHPDFEIVEVGKGTFELKADEGTIALIEKFPKQSAKLYEFDERYLIPVGEPKRESKLRRRLIRNDAEYVGPVARDFGDYDYNGRQYVGLDERPSLGYGVAVF